MQKRTVHSELLVLYVKYIWRLQLYCLLRHCTRRCHQDPLQLLNEADWTNETVACSAPVLKLKHKHSCGRCSGDVKLIHRNFDSTFRTFALLPFTLNSHVLLATEGKTSEQDGNHTAARAGHDFLGWCQDTLCGRWGISVTLWLSWLLF